MARPNRTSVRCSRPLHSGRSVKADGTRTYKDRRYQRYRCSTGQPDTHTFLFLITDPGESRPSWSPPPQCPRHPRSHVVRDGPYGTKTPSPRQLYLCTHGACGPTCKPGCKGHHRFTPPLPRDHVHPEDKTCALCDEHRGVHRGETAAARRHTWSTRTVARGLDMLSRGESYAETGRWALRQADVSLQRPRRRRLTKPVITTASLGLVGVRSVARTQSGVVSAVLVVRFTTIASATAAAPVSRATLPATPSVSTSAGRVSGALVVGRRRRSRPSMESRSVWHIAADWVEAFAPVIWLPVEERLRSAALAERGRLDALIAAGLPLDRPQVWLVDDVPVYGRDEGTRRARRDAGFYLLVIAEVTWEEPDPGDPLHLPVARQRLRLVRAMPKSNTHSWRICFAELGYAPDYIVADAGTGLLAAIRTHFRAGRTRYVPSSWHITRAVKESLLLTPGAFTVSPDGKVLVEEISEHLETLRRGKPALLSTAGWAQWWVDLEQILKGLKLPLVKMRNRRRNYEPAMAAVLPDLLANRAVPVSTGGLEKLIQKQVEPLLAMRRAVFGNIERTNALFDLAVARAHGSFDELGAVAKLLRTDALGHDGWTVPLRSIADPRPPKGQGRYASLRDATLLADLAAKAGLK